MRCENYFFGAAGSTGAGVAVAGADASATGAEAAGAGAAAGGAGGATGASVFLPQAARATAATKAVKTSDLFMSESLNNKR